MLPTLDFETYSEAGYDENLKAPKGAQKPGLSAVGAYAYAEHSSAEVLCMCYDMRDGLGVRTWLPCMGPPQELFDYVAAGGLIEAHNVFFEFVIWNLTCVRRYGWPPLQYWQVRDSLALALAFGLPPSLDKATEALSLHVRKNPDGKKLIRKFCVPRRPTKKDPRRRIRPEDDFKDFQKLVDYCQDDVRAEVALSQACPPLSEFETKFWLCTFVMNVRGIRIDTVSVTAACRELDLALERSTARLSEITSGEITAPSQVAKTLKWLQGRGVTAKSLDSDVVADLLDSSLPLPPDVREVLEIRRDNGSAGVKKYYAMERMVGGDGALHDLIVYHKARTGRDGGRDAQPQNLVKAGPRVYRCSEHGAYEHTLGACPWCHKPSEGKPLPWSWEHCEDVVRALQGGYLSQVFPNVVLAMSGALRGMFIGNFTCSDYSAIEAVVSAVLAGVEWRLQAFREKKDIYLVSASRITGTTFEQYEEYRQTHQAKHPDRQKIGKVAELALGFGGWLNAWRQFDKTANFTDQEVKGHILAWRDASPEIVEMWGGQHRGKPWEHDAPRELYGLEGGFVAAIESLGDVVPCGLASFQMRGDVLYLRLPSGRELAYHQPRLYDTRHPFQKRLTFMTNNTNPAMGPMGWVCMDTFGGRLFENLVQATSRDVLAHATVNLEESGEPVTMRIHDELLVDNPAGCTVEKVERIMGDLPSWAEGWPIRAAGGWQGNRYRKD